MKLDFFGLFASKISSTVAALFDDSSATFSYGRILKNYENTAPKCDY